MKVEIRVMQLQVVNARAAHQPHAAGKRQGSAPLQASEELPPWFQSSSLQNWKKTHLHCFKPSGLRHLAMTTLGNWQSIFLFVTFLKNKKVLNNFLKTLKYPEIHFSFQVSLWHKQYVFS